MFALFILRHADADTEAPTDAERFLSEKGMDQARKIGRFFRNQGFPFDHILTSPLVRARQTAELVAGELSRPDLVACVDFLTAGMNPATALKRLSQYAPASKESESPKTASDKLPDKPASRPGQSFLLVGHEPDLGEFVEYLVGSGQGTIHLKKAGLAKVTLPKWKAGVGTLEFLLIEKYL
jgi:phosphohistidine phosphatase